MYTNIHMMVIYSIINLKNGKKYIESTVNFSRRKNTHLRRLKQGGHHSKSLQASWNKNYPSDYQFLILEKITDKDILYQREQYWLDYYKTYEKDYGYNMTKFSTHPGGYNIKPVYQFNMSGEFIKEWDNCTRAGDSLGIDHSGLSKCARGKYRLYGGFIWDYNKDLKLERIKLANEPVKRSKESRRKMSIAAKNRKNQKKPILQYDLEGNFIKEWRSTSDLVEEMGYSNGYISDCLHGKHKKAYNYVWKFKDCNN